MKPKRNGPCPCGSKLKYKKCCGAIEATEDQPFSRNLNWGQVLDRQKAAEKIREDQQGLGRPIMSFEAHGHQVVAVGTTVHHSPSWRTFPDFLADYIKQIFGGAWGNAELAKPFTERHPLIPWYEALCRYQQATIKTPGVPVNAVVTGVVACYLGLAYGIYLLAHNVELQEKLVRRLKVPGQFQGAYYEVIVANILLRAGFELELEDESDGTVKHCEFSARSRRTGKKYWVEAKMQSVAGLLGKTERDGTTKTNPLNRFVPLLNEALAKPAADDRLIFIDLNADPKAQQTGKPPWIEQAARRLERYEQKDLQAGTVAYVFVTNFAFHRDLTGLASMAGFFFGLGIPDLNRPGVRRIVDAYRTKQKHIDVFHIGDALQTYARFPATFDGRMPSETTNAASRIIIGETYCLGDPETDGRVGTVTYASVNEANNEALVVITDPHGQSSLYRYPMAPEEMADWRAHKDSYFGKLLPVANTANNAFEMFEWLVDQHKGLTRDQLVARFAASHGAVSLSALSEEDLLFMFCEGFVAAMPGFKSPTV